MRKVVILGTAHRQREAGKQSPDGRLKEYIYSREIVDELNIKLQDYGIVTYIDFWPYDLPKTMQTPSEKLERQRELGLRVNEVNRICQQHGKENCIYVSIHVNASSSDGKWHKAKGWQVCISPQASNKSRLLANCLFDAADDFSVLTRKPLANQKYWEQSLYVLNRTLCPAVLTENLFQDNQNDVDFLLSDVGRHTIERIHLEGILNYIHNTD